MHRQFQNLAFDYRMGDVAELLVKIENPSGDIHWDDLEKFFSITPLPSAVIAYDEYIANSLLAACEQHRIGVPRDLSVAAVQDLLPHVHMPLTSVYGPEDTSKATEMACAMLRKRNRGECEPGTVVKLPPHLMSKASSVGVRVSSAREVSEVSKGA